MSEATPVRTLSYSQSVPSARSRLWAGAILSITSVGLIALGGCFLIGILSLIRPATVFGSQIGNAVPQWTPGMYVFAMVLSLLALSSFFSATWLLLLTLPKLPRTLSAGDVESAADRQQYRKGNS